jgi:putative aminopeptidase FrvX
MWSSCHLVTTNIYYTGRRSPLSIPDLEVGSDCSRGKGYERFMAPMKNDVQLIHEAWAAYPSLFEMLEQHVTPERGFDLFKRLADTYAPSLTARFTRGPMIDSMLQEVEAGPHLTFHPNYQRSGNVVLEIGKRAEKAIWCMAHLDFISFLTGEWTGGRYPLTSYCEPRQQPGRYDAIALQYDPDRHAMTEVAQGQLVMDESGKFWFECDNATLPPQTRVMYATQAEWERETGVVYGAIDDAFGCAALILAAQVLSHFPVEALFVLPDEEEGVVEKGNQAFARGSARLLQRTPPHQLPDLVIVTDVHEPSAEAPTGTADGLPLTRGALFNGEASKARGGITPPHLLHFQRQLAQSLGQQGVQLREDTGYVGRSDCVSAMMATPNVLRVGFAGAYSHFDQTPRAHIDDLVHLAKSIAAWVVVAQSEEWQERYLT